MNGLPQSRHIVGFLNAVNSRNQKLSVLVLQFEIPFPNFAATSRYAQPLLMEVLGRLTSKSTVSDRALIFPTPLLSQLQGWPGCQKIQFFFYK